MLIAKVSCLGRDRYHSTFQFLRIGCIENKAGQAWPTGSAPTAPAFQNPPSANPDFIAPRNLQDQSPQSYNHHSVCPMMRDPATQRGLSLSRSRNPFARTFGTKVPALCISDKNPFENRCLRDTKKSVASDDLRITLHA